MIQLVRLTDDRSAAAVNGDAFRSLFENANVAIFAIDAHSGCVIAANLQACALTGFSREELTDKPIATLHPVSEIRKTQNAWNEVQRNGRGAQLELYHWRKDGTLLPVNVEISTADFGGRRAVIHIVRDISPLKEMQVQQVRQANDLREARDLMLFSLAKLAEFRDPETGHHLERMSNYSMVLAKNLTQFERYAAQMNETFVYDILRSSPLHDIGKVGIPDLILLKPGQLTPDEYQIMKNHSLIGGDAISVCERQLRGHTFLKLAREIAYHHHEKWDGNGYPAGLKGLQIPLSSRIVALADAYDAITSKRCYKMGESHEEARRRILEASGTHFDPDIVQSFLMSEREIMRIQKRYGD